MQEELDAILARAQRAIAEMERLSAMAERLSSEARKVLVSLEPTKASPENACSPTVWEESPRKG